jgi:hypothetical protein
MDNEYTSMWQFLTKNPAGKLMIATVAAVGLAACYALTIKPTQVYEPYRTQQTYTQNAHAKSPDAGIAPMYSELSDIVEK